LFLVLPIFLVGGGPWRVDVGSRLAKPSRSDARRATLEAWAKESVMSHPRITEQQVQRAEELVSWTRRERIRFLWYRLRLTVQEMNYATGRMIEPHMYLP
jgi:hypothetical protein